MKKKLTQQTIILSSIVTALTMFFYYPSLFYPFQFDDLANIAKSFSIRSNTFANLFFSGPRWISSWMNSLYYTINKFNPFWYRFGNILTHTLTGLCIFFLLHRLLTNLKDNNFYKRNALAIAYATAGLFLLHPVQTQTVSYVIQGQLEGLSGLLMIATISVFVTWTQKKNVLYLGLIYISAAIASGTKEIAIVTPMLLLIIDWFFIAQGSWQSLKRRWLFHAFFFAFVVGIYFYFLKPSYFSSIFGLRLSTPNNLGNLLTESPDQKITPIPYAMSQFKVIVHYLWMFIFPFNISVDYDWKLVTNFFTFDCLAPLTMLTLLSALVMHRLRYKQTDLLSFGIIWFFICILPRSSIIPSTELLADYKTYLGSMGLLFIIATGIIYILTWCLDRIQRNFQNIVYVILTCLFLPLGYLLHARNTVWRSAEEFWANIVKNAPRKARAHNNYGVALCDLDKANEALIHFKKAIELDTQYADPYNNMAVAYGVLDQTNNAIIALRNSIKLHPYQPEGYNNIASFLLKKEDFEEAEKMLTIALKLRPHYGKAYYNLGRLYYEMDKKEDAWRCFKDCCTKADFDNEQGFTAYAQASFLMQKHTDAIFGFKKVLELNPYAHDAKINLAHSHFMAKQYQEACILYTHLAQQQQNNSGILFQTGETLMALEKFAEALTYYQKVTYLDTGMAPAYLRIARCLDKLKRRKEACNYLRTFLAMEPPEKFKKIALEALKKME